MKLVLLSDLHLPPLGQRIGGIDPHARLKTAIDRINTAYGDADLVVIAGDLVDLGQAEGYRALRTALERLGPPVALTLGNHDDRAAFAEIFGETHLNADGFAQTAHTIDGHRVILLDSCTAAPSGEPWQSLPGTLCNRRLAWLAAQLDDRPTIIVMHHPILAISDRPDHYALNAPEPLLDLLDAHDVQLVLSGHLHMTTTVIRQGTPHMTIAGALSTNSEEFPTGMNKRPVQGPAEMAIILSNGNALAVHSEHYSTAEAAFDRTDAA